MLFSNAINGLPNTDLTDEQMNELHTGIKGLDSFFNENYEEGDKFSNTFWDKFSTLINKYGFDIDTQETILDRLYEVEELKNFAMNMIITIRNISGESDFCEYTYEQMLSDMQDDYDS